jgi:hypothetical protein
MKIVPTISFVILAAALVSCDVQSGITKKSVEKYVETPTPRTLPTPEETPIDPADIVQVDTEHQGDLISVNESRQKKTIVCNKYNRLMINNHDNVLIIKGACSQIMVNGDRNDITAEAVMEIVFNGSENTVRYSRYPNGRRPLVSDNNVGNLAEKASDEGNN